LLIRIEELLHPQSNIDKKNMIKINIGCCNNCLVRTGQYYGSGREEAHHISAVLLRSEILSQLPCGYHLHPGGMANEREEISKRILGGCYYMCIGFQRRVVAYALIH